ncbi:F0F1 ATP synthase subunit gamma [Lichenihabitans psoromatis]|uniref:F0F1 ATP synthase subunit gamma n=1 Tax=Lichenihabitans psoromatis TaxID=2528642 RepID=UPI001036D664|nr:FoF1 ATP synthase subunit gamma [Lichenihabitans psoromatis]
MTERLAEVGARIEGIRQLGAVVNAMRGIAAARAQRARGQLGSVERYTETIAAAIRQALALLPIIRPDGARRPRGPALVLFCAEQGFAGAFSERILDAAAEGLAKESAKPRIYLLGTRGGTVARGRGVSPTWSSPMPAHSDGIPRLADRVAEALYADIANGTIDQLDAVFSRWTPGHGATIEHRRLFPIDVAIVAPAVVTACPIVNLGPAVLLRELTAAYIHAELCTASLHAFAAENEARLQAMSAAHSQIDRQLAALQAAQRIVRQNEITEEIIELAAGETASRSGRG